MAMLIRNGGSVGWQTFLVVISLWLPKVVVSHTIDEDHQHGPGHKEKHCCGERIDQHADLEPSLHPAEAN